MAEIGPVIGHALRIARELDAWDGGGEDVMLERCPWNYPIVLTFQPLSGTITAGCPALIEPSEVVPTFSKLLAELIPKYLDPSAYRVALDGLPEIPEILELEWAHIYTGNARIAHIIEPAAAKHLAPMTLELGGKSPLSSTASIWVRRAGCGGEEGCGWEGK
ncbi:Aldehyde/histidinol dehydrogenase [Ephemerocybe angulata]|uniref:Aldehyde/histidinol dehydrogenase n=1 Tax=Ephemerocybe angulata TaxID=980116 RepID=A0A8H6H7D6_9AGAR|nr:Aldehyde/histidinol dehydrogenase [Tulosesus angulatus]